MRRWALSAGRKRLGFSNRSDTGGKICRYVVYLSFFFSFRHGGPPGLDYWLSRHHRTGCVSLGGTLMIFRQVCERKRNSVVARWDRIGSPCVCLLSIIHCVRPSGTPADYLLTHVRSWAAESHWCDGEVPCGPRFEVPVAACMRTSRRTLS